MQSLTVDTINKKLKQYYGVNTYGDANFRVVHSDDQSERRKIKKESNLLLLFQDYEIKEVKTYPYIKSKWLLERWISGKNAYHPDLVTLKDGVYICVYVFQDKYQQYLPPLWKVAEIIVKALLNPRSKSEAFAQDIKDEETKEEKETREMMQELEIQSDEVRTKDKNSKKDSISEGYVKETIH